MNIKKQIYSIKNSFSPEEVFLTKDYVCYLHEVLAVVTRKYRQKIEILLRREANDVTASTNGVVVNINYDAEAIDAQTDIKDKNSAIIGTLLHESGHILYTDFALANKCMEKLKKESKFMPAPDISDESSVMLDWISQNGVPDALLSLYSLFDNVIEDGNVDWRIMADVPGYGVCRKKLLKWYADTCPSYEELNKNPMKSIVLCQMILGYAKYGIFLSADQNDEVVQKFFEIKVKVDEACMEKTSYERKRLINNLFASFFSIFLKDIENQENEEPENNDSSQSSDEQNQQSQSGEQNSPNSNNQPQSSNGSDSSNGNTSNSPGPEQSQNSPSPNSTNTDNSGENSPSASSQISSDKMQAAMQNLLSSLPNALTKQEQHTGNTTPSGDGSVQNSSPIPDNQNTPDKDIGNLMEHLAHQKLSDTTEAGIKTEVREICRDIEHNANIHRGIKVNVARATPNMSVYDTEAKELSNITRRLSKNFKKDIVERQLGDIENGLYFGKRLCTSQLYREDKKIFEKKTLPDDIPDMEVVLLVDLSGSMGGERIEAARKTASILYAFCQELNIRVSVYGHHVVHSGFTIDIFADANSIDNKDKYRICDMDARGCNRDGLAVRYCMEKLARSTATAKLLTVISDGRPNDDDYGLSEGKADIQDALTKYGKMGVRTITAALGSDIEAIKTIYTNKYASVLDISDLNRLPALFPKIIKKML